MPMHSVPTQFVCVGIMQDDGEEGEDELSVRMDVEDDACVDYVCVPVVGEEEGVSKGRYTA